MQCRTSEFLAQI